MQLRKVREVYAKADIEGKLTDSQVHYCESCNRCWESAKVFKWKGKVRKPVQGYYFYEDFPTWGKKRVICSDCSGAKLQVREYRGMLLWEVVDDNKLQKTKGE